MPPPEPPPPASAPRRRTRWPWIAAAAALLAGAAAGLWYLRSGSRGEIAGGGDGEAPAAEFVGSAACASCHAQQVAAWNGSHHQRAMQPAGEGTVLGDFGDARFTYGGVATRFFRENGKFMVHTEGADGRTHDYEVKYTYGVEPLQQYLIELGSGRLQPLSISWDSRPEAEGGQRWFHLYPGDRIEHTSDLHWTGQRQNWNFMCADCHSTGVRKNYDPDADRFRTSWAEVNVACEACHGPASRHLEWAAAGEGRRDARWPNRGLAAALTERRGVSWTVDPTTGNPRRSVPRATDREIETCAQCHSRRAQVGEGYHAGAPLLDFYLPSLLMPGLYHPDGQQLDEVYTYGSFLQSRMYAAGVTCSDCHDPHSQKLRLPGNQLCGQCHAPARYDAPAHHFHPTGSAGARCASCHMPATTYMRVDPRSDHSFRVPRPDLTVEMGVPNACTGCHQDRPAAWAAEAVRRWYGRDPVGFQRFARAFHADERTPGGAPDTLAAIARDPSHPTLVRASALARLVDTPVLVAVEAARASLSDPSPLVRRAGLSVLEALAPGERVALAAPLLGDSSRIVRLQAAWMLAPAASGLADAGVRAAFTRASNEFIASQRYLADRPENRITLGSYYGMLGRGAEAEAEYRAALRLARGAVPAYVNLADLYRAQGREAEAERILRQGIEAAPEDASLRHSLGLALARRGDVAAAVRELERAAELAPEEARFAYAYAVALNSSGRYAEAVRVLEGALRRAPADFDLLFALATFHRDAGRTGAALEAAERLHGAHPGRPEAAQLRASLR